MLRSHFQTFDWTFFVVKEFLNMFRICLQQTLKRLANVWQTALKAHSLNFATSNKCLPLSGIGVSVSTLLQPVFLPHLEWKNQFICSLMQCGFRSFPFRDSKKQSQCHAVKKLLGILSVLNFHFCLNLVLYIGKHFFLLLKAKQLKNLINSSHLIILFSLNDCTAYY